MKRWHIIVISVLALSFLIFLLYRDHAENVKKEKVWYIGKLHYEFSAEVDSVIIVNKKRGRLLFHLTAGRIQTFHERYLNEQLKYSGRLRFLVFRSDDQIEIVVNTVVEYLRGDSLYVNTDANRIALYRNGMKISESEILPSLRGRPF